MKRADILAIILFSAAGFALSSEPDPTPETLRLKDFKPCVMHKVPVTLIKRAKFPAINMHAHARYAKTPEQVAAWIEIMDSTHIEKVIVLSQAHGARFDSVMALYGVYPDRFEVWCGIDYSGCDSPDFGPGAIRELERCYQKGARGVGELGDKGKGLFYCDPPAWGMHFDDPRMDPILDKCAELGMPVSIHAGEPYWFYQPLDETNDGLMQAYVFRLDKEPLPGKSAIVGHAGMVRVLENAVAKHPDVTFIACHFANLSHDLDRLGRVLDRHPNLYVDIAAQYAETATIPRHAARFYKAHAGRIVYGTDWPPDLEMHRISFRILETLDEHFYALNKFGLPLSVGYHWTMNGFGLDDGTLKKVYRENALRIMSRSRRSRSIER